MFIATSLNELAKETLINTAIRTQDLPLQQFCLILPKTTTPPPTPHCVQQLLSKWLVDRHHAPDSDKNPADQEFLHVTWRDESGTHVGENEYLPKRPKYYDLKTPQISVEVQGDSVTLSSDVPAFFVTYDHGGSDIWSDNGFTLLPGVPKTLHRQRKRSGPIGEAKIRYLS